MKPRHILQQSTAIFMSLCLALEPVAANAGGGGLVVDPAAAQKASVGQAPNGVATIDIVAPNGAGLSHNKFSEFNVAPSGVVLNNANSDGISQLGGALLANPNLVGKSSASTILAEVTSASRSRLEGFTEVFGGSADFILANPNGITCNGCGFIGAPRAVLTTGAPQLDPRGGISGFAVDGGDIAVGGGGLDAAGIDVLDLISRSVTVNGRVNGKSVNVVAGRNDVAYADRAATARAADPAGAPLYAIDSTALGGMYANRITLVATEQGVGVNMQDDMAANAGELRITADGGLALRSVSAAGDIALASRNGDVTVSEQAMAREALTIGAAAIEASNATISAGTDLAINATDRIVAKNAQISAGKTAALTSGQALDLTRGTVQAGSDVTLSGTSITLDGGKALAGVAPDGTLSQEGSLTITTTGVVSYAEGGRIAAGKDVSIHAGTLDGGASSLGIAAGRDIVVAANTVANATGGMQADRDVSIAAASTTIDGGDATAGRDLTVTARDLSNKKTLSASGAMTLAATASIANGTGATITSGGPLVLSSASISNGGRISSQGTARATAPLFSNAGSFSAAQDLTLQVSSLLTNRGLLFAGKRLVIAAPGTLTNDGGDIIGGTGLVIDGGASGAAGTIENVSGTMQAGLGDGVAADMSITAARISNRKSAFTTTTRTERASGEDTSGVDCRGANEGCQNSVSYEIQEIATDSTAPKILADGAMRLEATQIANDQGLIHANGTLTLRGETLTNSAPVFTVTRIVTKVMHWYSKHCNWRHCSDSRWTTTATDRSLQSSTNVFGTIETSGILDALFTGSVANVGVTQGTALYGLSAGSPEDSVKGVSFDVRSTPISGASVVLPSEGNAGLYVRTKSPDTKYLVETDPVLSNLGKFYGSSYFLDRAGIDTNAIAKRLGDDAYETKLVRDAIFAETGKRYLSDDITSDAAQMQRLMDNALLERQALGLSFGVSLSAEQIAALTHDIVWFEQVQIDGETVLAPHLYLARVTTANIDPRSARIVATSANIQAAQIANSGLIATDGALKIASSGDVRNQGGALKAGTALSVTAGNDVLNLSGTMSGKTVAIEAGRDVVASTLVTTITEGGATDAIMHQQAAISGDDGVTVTAKRDIATAGARVTSGADATLTAGRDILLNAATATDSTNFTFKNGSASSQKTRNLGSTVDAVGNLALSAGGDIALAGSTASAGKAAVVDAGGNVLATSVQDSESYQAAVSSKSGGLFGGGKQGFSESSSSTTTIGSAITGG